MYRVLQDIPFNFMKRIVLLTPMKLIDVMAMCMDHILVFNRGRKYEVWENLPN